MTGLRSRVRICIVSSQCVFMAFRWDTKKLQIGGSFISTIFNNLLVSKVQRDAYNNNKHKAHEISKMTIKSKTENKRSVTYIPWCTMLFEEYLCRECQTTRKTCSYQFGHVKLRNIRKRLEHLTTIVRAVPSYLHSRPVAVSNSNLSIVYTDSLSWIPKVRGEWQQ